MDTAPQEKTIKDLGLGAFDTRKAEYLLAKRATRDVRQPNGQPLIGKDEAFTVAHIELLVASGMLNTIFLETTQRL